MAGYEASAAAPELDRGRNAVMMRAVHLAGRDRLGAEAMAAGHRAILADGVAALKCAEVDEGDVARGQGASAGQNVVHVYSSSRLRGAYVARRDGISLSG